MLARSGSGSPSAFGDLLAENMRLEDSLEVVDYREQLQKRLLLWSDQCAVYMFLWVP